MLDEKMGIRITSKSDKITLQDLSEFLHHLDNIYKAEVFLLQNKENKIPEFYKKKLKNSESIFVAKILKQSPWDILIVPAITYGEMAGILFTILQIIRDEMRSRRNRNSDNNENEKNQRKRMMKAEFEHRQVRRYDDVVIEESVKMTFSKIEIDDVEIHDETYRDYFGEDPKDD